MVVTGAARRTKLDVWFAGIAAAAAAVRTDSENVQEAEDDEGEDECIGVAPPSFRDPGRSLDDFTAAHGACTLPSTAGNAPQYRPTALGAEVTSYKAWTQRVAAMERTLAEGSAPPIPECVAAYVAPGAFASAQEVRELSLGRITWAILTHDAALRHGQRIEAKVGACFGRWGMPVPETPLVAQWRRKLWRAADHERTTVRDVVEQIEHDHALLQFDTQLESATAEAERIEQLGLVGPEGRFVVRAAWSYLRDTELRQKVARMQQFAKRRGNDRPSTQAAPTKRPRLPASHRYLAHQEHAASAMDGVGTVGIHVGGW